MTKIDTSIAIIGHKECIDFPEQGLFDVPAKIDTGADSSAIWASDIREEDGTLHFVLFDRASRYYTGTSITTRKFSVTSIKNSFGQTEFRYKVLLKIRLSGKLLNVRFTLANRENNSQPILIGRRTLHGKFLVDVARQAADDATCKRLLLMSAKHTDAVEAFARGVEAMSDGRIAVSYVTYNEVDFIFANGTPKIVVTATGEDIASFDMVHFKTWAERDVTAAMASYLQNRGVSFFDKRAVHFASNSKLYQYVRLGDAGIPIPAAMFVMPSRYDTMYEAFVDKLGLPFVFKASQASRGAHNYLVTDRVSYGRAVSAIRESGVFAIAQQFIPNDGDYRILVLGRHIALVIHRNRSDDTTHLNNTSQGGTARLLDPQSLVTEVRTDSISATVLLELGIAGVDMIQDKLTGKWYCLELNGDPQMASGAFVAEKQAAYAEYIESELSRK